MKTLAVGLLNTALFTSPHATPDLDPEAALLNIIKRAKKSILFSTYGWSLVSLAQVVIDKHVAGVVVRGVADRSSFHGKNSQYQAMVDAGLDIHLWGGQYNLNHEKVIIIDDKTVALGSYNLTHSAEKSNKEVLVIFTGVQVSKLMVPILSAQIQHTYASGTPPLKSATTILSLARQMRNRK